MNSRVKIKAVVLLRVLIVFVEDSQQNVVITAQGRLRGEVHKGYVSYKGVPYASIVGDDGKFKRAGLAPRWSGVRDAHKNRCSLVSGQECLKLDVHVPSEASPDRWPVLVWVADGVSHYNSASLVRKGIIVVIAYHRMNALGFLCLGEDKIPGNAGVKDIVMALRWVRDNIIAFGGNAEKVVIAGQGFGAAMAEGVTLSPMAVGLFHGVILQSGSILAPWAFNYDAKERATKLGTQFTHSDKLSEIFLKTKIEELVDKSNKLDMPYFPFGMCKENAIKHEERLLSETPIELLTSRKVAKVPMIIGYNSEEAYIFSSFLRDSKVTKTMSRGIAFLLPDELKFLNEREMKQVASQLGDMYFKTNKTLRAVVEYHRDAYFLSHTYRSVRLHASAYHAVYFYQFSYSGKLGVQDEPGLVKNGAAHSDELAYLFSAMDLEGDEGTVQMHLVKLWSDFVKHLDPTYKEATSWETFDSEHPRLLDIGVELKMIDFPQQRTIAVWDNIYDKYYYTRNLGRFLYSMLTSSPTPYLKIR